MRPLILAGVSLQAIANYLATITSGCAGGRPWWFPVDPRCSRFACSYMSSEFTGRCQIQAVAWDPARGEMTMNPKELNLRALSANEVVKRCIVAGSHVSCVRDWPDTGHQHRTPDILRKTAPRRLDRGQPRNNPAGCRPVSRSPVAVTRWR